MSYDTSTSSGLDIALDEAEVTAQALARYRETDSYYANLRSRYERNHHYYRPVDGDQWPQDKALRPGMIHVTANIIAPAVETESRLESLLPRITNTPDVLTEELRKRAEAAERLMYRFLELSGWDIWLADACKIKAIYGKTVWKVFWNKEDDRPDVVVLENPANLRIGWGSNDFRVMDWTLYEYSISPIEAMRRFPEITIVPSGDKRAPLTVFRAGDHSDPLGTMANTQSSSWKTARPANWTPSDYERKQVSCWDYWFKDEKGVIKNAIFINGVLAGPITTHTYLPDLPYIVVEHGHEPGTPEGLALVDDLLDIQIEINRALSHWAQLVADELDPAWQVDADSIPGGSVPRGGEITPAGEGHIIRALEKPVNQFPIQALLAELYKTFHFISGLSEIMFSLPPGAQTAGRALAIQIESSINRIDPRRRRLYRGLYELVIFWSYMAEKINPKIVVGVEPDTGKPIKAGLKELFSGLRRWKFVAPEITPRDVIENTTNVINKLQAKLVSLEDGMDELGVDAPLEMIGKIMRERTNPALFPGETQAYVAVMDLLQKMQAQAQALPSGPPPGDGGGSPQDQAAGTQVALAQAAQPTLDQAANQSGPPQPLTQAGSPPPVGSPPPGSPIQNQTLIRSTPSGAAQALQQIKLTTGGG